MKCQFVVVLCIFCDNLKLLCFFVAIKQSVPCHISREGVNHGEFNNNGVPDFKFLVSGGDKFWAKIVMGCKFNLALQSSMKV